VIADYAAQPSEAGYLELNSLAQKAENQQAGNAEKPVSNQALPMKACCL
jgi:hypothetical protein